MKKSVLTIAVFAILLFCSQMSFGQKVTCYDGNSYSESSCVTAPYFSADLIAEADCDTYAEASVCWDWGWASKGCPGNCGFENIGRQDAGGINVTVGCYTDGYGTYASSEA